MGLRWGFEEEGKLMHVSLCGTGTWYCRLRFKRTLKHAYCTLVLASFLCLYCNLTSSLLFPRLPPHILLLPLSSQGQACCICKVHNTFPHPSTAQSPPSSLISRKHNERDVNKLNEGLTRCWCLSLPRCLVTPRQAATENKVPGTRCSVSFLFWFLFAYSFFHLEFR